ncbi:MAG: branched-chain amino acid transporter [Variovorax paradoxus]|uniref:Branched-chain amino acid transporter n=1 Tax=Variovorax paradoxus TaxID=34073 RepID=A0A2W5QF72_VARPD|nr:MAG: branched-chain amino acid transporter [Variovorax paradoxus]
MKGQTDLWTLAVIVGLAAVTVLTRCFFFILDRPWGLPEWAHRALHYAPAAALAAVIAPEILMTNGQFIHTWQDARLGVLGTMLAGMAVYLPLHLMLRW